MPALTAIALTLVAVLPPEGPAGRSMLETTGGAAPAAAVLVEMAPRTVSRSDSDVAVVVAAGLADDLAPEIERLRVDLQAEGWNVTVSSMSGGTAEDLRSYLAGVQGLDGAILIGSLPAAWYEMNEWGGKHEEFPLDLYLMDLDGSWTDADADGLLDGHTGDRGAEIWIGRIDASAIEWGNELALLRDYLTANHLYRTGSLSVPPRALSFVDDDWSSWYGGCGLGSIYGDLTVVGDEAQTTAAEYRERLGAGYEFVHLMAHSSPWGHTFKVPYGYGGTMMAPEISEINPATVFVQLFACSNCRWTEPGCLGNWYLFGTDTGLLAVGATKTGSMLEFEEFYEPIGEGQVPGKAFVSWFNAVGIHDPPWHYGCVLLGDPTLMPLSGRERLGAALPGVAGPHREHVRVSTSPHSDCFPVCVSAGGSVYVAWLTGDNGRLDVAAREWDGESWSGAYTVDADEYWDVTPCLALDGEGDPWLAWADFDYGSYGYRIKTATGHRFGDVTVAASGDGLDVDPCLAHTDRMWLAWQVWRRGQGDIMVKSLDGSFPETYLSAPGAGAFSPTAAAGPGGMLHVAWVETTPQGERIMWTQGDGDGFGTPEEVSTGGFCRSPGLFAAGDRLVLLWESGGEQSRILARVWDGGEWGDAEELYSSPEDQAFSPACGLSPQGEVFAAWQVGAGTDAALLQSTLTGSGWTGPAVLVETAGPAWSPALSDGFIAWAGTAGAASWDIYAEMDGGVGIEGGEGPSAPSVRILRNPVRTEVVLLVEGTEGPVSASLYDLSGRRVSEVSASPDAGGTIALPCSGLPSGVYSVRVESGGELTTGLVTLLR